MKRIILTFGCLFTLLVGQIEGYIFFVKNVRVSKQNTTIVLEFDRYAGDTKPHEARVLGSNVIYISAQKISSIIYQTQLRKTPGEHIDQFVWASIVIWTPDVKGRYSDYELKFFDLDRSLAIQQAQKVLKEITNIVF
jgi:hypothetical protein